MATSKRTLYLIAAKLGLGCEDKVLKKAAEFERLLQTKSIAATNINGNGKIVICLDLAARELGTELDIKLAIQYSGLKPSTYKNNRKIIENLLELNTAKLTVSFLCVTLKCVQVQSLAEKILEEYELNSKMAVDLNLPHYACMAVYQACRLSKVKMSKTKLIEKSRLKPMQWNKMDAEWIKFVNSKFTACTVKKQKQKSDIELVDNVLNMDIDKQETMKDNQESEDAVEPYEDWKHRILNVAYMELQEIELVEKNKNIQSVFRRSPRKSPQKHAPYKSPSKVNGVRHLLQYL